MNFPYQSPLSDMELWGQTEEPKNEIPEYYIAPALLARGIITLVVVINLEVGQQQLYNGEKDINNNVRY